MGYKDCRVLWRTTCGSHTRQFILILLVCIVVLVTIAIRDPDVNNDVYDNVPNVEGPRFSNVPPGPIGPTMVLLQTYLRSGSTLTADIIQQAKGVFYAYEPLKHYIKDKDGYLSLNGICSSHHLKCRPPVMKTEEPNTCVKEFSRFYNCQLTDLTYPFMRSKISRSDERYKTCLRNSNIDSCSNQCIDSTRSLKTIRLSMDIVGVLMKKLRNLKVVHLLRDPRGMIHSRKRGRFVEPWMNLTIVARSVCQRFERDIEIAMKLKQKYPGRLKTYLYEQIAEHPKLSSASLFNFLGLTASDNFDMWLHNHTAAGTNGQFYDTLRANSSLTASSWRLRMKMNDASIIDNECKKYYKYTGILKAKSQHLLKDLNYPMRLSSPIFGDFL